MNKSPIKSRNKKVIHEDYYICSHCKNRVYYNDLPQDNIDQFSENTSIITCPTCGFQDVPNVTIDIEYIYSGHCSRKDGK